MSRTLSAAALVALVVALLPAPAEAADRQLSIGAAQVHQEIVVVGGESRFPQAELDSLSQETGLPVVRAAGSNRYQTAAVATGNAPVGSPVLVTTGDNFPDALAAGPLAAANGAVVLLVSHSSVPEPTAEALERLEPSRIIVVGGQAAVSNAVVDDLAQYGTGIVTRIGGATRFHTAAQLADAAFPAGADRVFIADGATFADSLAGGVAAAGSGAPLLLTANGQLPEPTRQALQRLRPDTVVLLGGHAAISAEVEQDLSRSSFTVRLAGRSRAETAQAVASYLFPAGSRRAFIASGDNFADALAIVPIAASALAVYPQTQSGVTQGGPVLLTLDSIVRGNGCDGGCDPLDDIGGDGSGSGSGGDGSGSGGDGSGSGGDGSGGDGSGSGGDGSGSGSGGDGSGSGGDGSGSGSGGDGSGSGSGGDGSGSGGSGSGSGGDGSGSGGDGSGDGEDVVPPVAGDDAFNAIGNVRFYGGFERPLNNQHEPAVYTTATLGANDADVSRFVPEIGTSSRGGTYQVFANGRFIYDPPPGGNLDDTFTYTVESDPDEGSPGTATATVTMTLDSRRAWFVDTRLTANGNGTSLSPFDSIEAAQAASEQGDHIFVYEDNAPDGSVTLKNYQSLIGGPQAWAVDGLDVRPAQDLGTVPAYTDTITLAHGTTVDGGTVTATVGPAITGTEQTMDPAAGQPATTTLADLVISDAETGILLTDADFHGLALDTVAIVDVTFGVTILGGAGDLYGDLDIDQVRTRGLDIRDAAVGAELDSITITHTGTNLGHGIRIDGQSGTFTVHDDVIVTLTSSSSDAYGIVITDTFNGEFDFQGDLSVTGPPETAIALTGPNGPIGIGRLDLSGFTGDGLDIDGFHRNVTIGSGTIDGTDTTGVPLTIEALDPGNVVAINGTSIYADAETADAFRVVSTDGTITYTGGAIQTSSARDAVNVGGLAGTLTMTTPINHTGTGPFTEGLELHDVDGTFTSSGPHIFDGVNRGVYAGGFAANNGTITIGDTIVRDVTTSAVGIYQTDDITLAEFDIDITSPGVAGVVVDDSRLTLAETDLDTTAGDATALIATDSNLDISDVVVAAGAGGIDMTDGLLERLDRVTVTEAVGFGVSVDSATIGDQIIIQLVIGNEVVPGAIDGDGLIIYGYDAVEPILLQSPQVSNTNGDAVTVCGIVDAEPLTVDDLQGVTVNGDRETTCVIP